MSFISFNGGYRINFGTFNDGELYMNDVEFANDIAGLDITTATDLESLPNNQLLVTGSVSFKRVSDPNTDTYNYYFYSDTTGTTPLFYVYHTQIHNFQPPVYLCLNKSFADTFDVMENSCMGVFSKDYDSPPNTYVDGRYSGISSRSEGVQKLNAWFSQAEVIGWQGRTTGARPSRGTFDLKHQSIDFSELPSKGAVDAGLVTLYNPTDSELEEISKYLFSTDILSAIDSTIMKQLSNPLDFIIGLSLYPISIPQSSIAGPIKVKCGGIPMLQMPIAIPTTNLTSHYLTSQYVAIDAGYIDFDEFYGGCLDFAPNTKLSIFVPYCGSYQLNTDDIMANLYGTTNEDGKHGRRVSLRYNVDLFNGACVAELKCGDTVLYQWSGSMAQNVPLTGTDYSQALNAVMGAATSIAMASGNAGAAKQAAKNAKGANAKAQTAQAASAASRELTSTIASSTANSLASMKPNVQRAGSSAGPTGFLGIQVPYITKEIPKQAIDPEAYAEQNGWPSAMYRSLHDVKSGSFVSIDAIHLTDIENNAGAAAVDQELGELETLLMGGVII